MEKLLKKSLRSAQQSVGFIETSGYLATIAVADTCLKAADVNLMGLEMAGAGMVTVVIEGDISATQQAVDAGVAQAKNLGAFLSSSVIGRPAFNIADIIAENLPANDQEKGRFKEAPGNETCYECQLIGVKEDLQFESENNMTKINVFSSVKQDNYNQKEIVPGVLLYSTESPETTPSGDFEPMNKTGGLDFRVEELSDHRVVDLREIARHLDGFSMSKNQIKFAKKDALVKAIINWHQQTK